MAKVMIPLGLDIDVYQEVEKRRIDQKQSRSGWINCELRKILFSVEAVK